MADGVKMALRRICGVLVFGAVLLGGCSAGGVATNSPAAATLSATGNGGSSPGGGSASGSAAPAALALSVLNTASNGLILVGPTGMAVYVHQGDTVTNSTCTGACLQGWPAVTVAAGGTVTASSQVPGAVATFVRPDNGSSQVTYDGHPLYYWTGDTKPGDVTGHGISGFAVVSLPGSGPPATPCSSSCNPAPASPRSAAPRY
jgi:predicted lipoprotein with Yx(FWY)xxD motif